MTNEEMIKWAKLEEASAFIWHAHRENLDALIWIAKKQAKIEVWRKLGEQARMCVDMELLESYPGGLLKRKKLNDNS